MAAHWQRLALWFADEIATPIAQYRQPLHKLAQRAAAAVLLGEPVEPYRSDLESLAGKAEGLRERGELAASTLLVASVIDESIHGCVAQYASAPDAGATEALRSDDDEVALGASLLTGRRDIAELARSRRVTRRFDSAVPISAELVFLADEVRNGTSGDIVLFSTVRGIHRSILTSVNRTVAPFVCAFAAAAGNDLAAHLRGAARQYDELSFAGEKAPYRLLPERLEIDPVEPRVRIHTLAAGDGFRLDVINAPPLLDELPTTFDALRRALADKDKRRFDKLRKSADTELEIVVRGGARLEAADVFARRVAAALALMTPNGYGMDKVVVTTQAAKD
jgi:hypothetical protein